MSLKTNLHLDINQIIADEPINIIEDHEDFEQIFHEESKILNFLADQEFISDLFNVNQRHYEQ